MTFLGNYGRIVELLCISPRFSFFACRYLTAFQPGVYQHDVIPTCSFAWYCRGKFDRELRKFPMRGWLSNSRWFPFKKHKCLQNIAFALKVYSLANISTEYANHRPYAWSIKFQSNKVNKYFLRLWMTARELGKTAAKTLFTETSSSTAK